MSPPRYSAAGIGPKEFRDAFETAFGPDASAAGLVRARRRSLQWSYACPDGSTLQVGFRLNMKNLAGYPGEFMPDVFWSRQRHDRRDTGEVSFYQYTLSSDIEAMEALRRHVVDGFIAEMRLESELQDRRSLTALLQSACDIPIRPHQGPWLTYWNHDDVAAWGRLFGGLIAGWLRRFVECPETLDSYYHRVVCPPRS